MECEINRENDMHYKNIKNQTIHVSQQQNPVPPSGECIPFHFLSTEGVEQGRGPSVHEVPTQQLVYFPEAVSCDQACPSVWMQREELLAVFAGSPKG